MTSGSTSNVITDLNGRPVPSLTASLTVGKAGPILLQDVNLVNLLAHFDREKIPDRVVHTKGGGAHGIFEVTHDITQYTRAAVFSYIGKTTPVFVRFSTVQFESGSSDTLNDPRGFAVKFYTEHGNWDLPGCNLPVFPIRDPILFPSLIRSRKRNPSTHLRDVNMFWDFTSLRPETTHHTLQLYSDLGYPDGFRHMNGAGVHTFKLVNQEGEPIYCKFHFRTNQGVKNLTRERAMFLAGDNPDYSIEDLYTSIQKNDYPSWNMSIQVMTFEEAADFRWNPFDITKLWPEDQFPLLPVGRLTLNKNPVDYFTEVEFAAFDPGNLVPGIEMSPDPMFHGRSFSYQDAQRHRLGPNFQQLPINKPLVQVNSFDRDGKCAMENGDGRPNYFPNSFDNLVISPIAAESVFHLHADVVREDTGDEDNFSQAKMYLDSLTCDQRERLVSNLAYDMMNVIERIQNRMLDNFEQVDVSFANEVRVKIDELLLKRKQ